MDPSVIAVTPLAVGWSVTVDEIANDLVYRSGREAEVAARRLAARLSLAGIPCRIEIRLRDGTLAGRLDGLGIASLGGA